MLLAPTNRRERIMVMGSFGTGKTTSWLNIAKWSQATGSPARFYAIDTDGALEAFLEGNTQYSELENVEYTAAFEWSEYESSLNAYRKKMTNDDWIIVDFLSNSWQAVQEHYIAEIYNIEMADFFMDARKSIKAGNALDGWKDWSVINRLHKGWINNLIHRTPGHKFFTAMPEPLRDTDDKGIRAAFGPHRVRPKGQKELGYLPHTILLLTAIRQGEPYVTTIKDRERMSLDNQRLNDFTIDYLVNVAGWSL